MNERNEVFRQRLIAVMTELNASRASDPELRQKLGNFAMRLYKDGRARSWADLKERADGATYDSLLKLFQERSAEATRSGDKAAARASELLALSLIARRQTQEDLKPGVDALDKFIAEAAAAVHKASLSRPGVQAGAR